MITPHYKNEAVDQVVHLISKYSKTYKTYRLLIYF